MKAEAVFRCFGLFISQVNYCHPSVNQPHLRNWQLKLEDALDFCRACDQVILANHIVLKVLRRKSIVVSAECSKPARVGCR
jgi:hypothetical protein